MANDIDVVQEKLLKIQELINEVNAELIRNYALIGVKELNAAYSRVSDARMHITRVFSEKHAKVEKEVKERA